MIMHRRWSLVTCFLAQLWCAVSPGALSAQENGSPDPLRAPRFLFVVKSGYVALDVERTPALMQRISLSLDGVLLEQALTIIARESGVRFGFTDQVLPGDKHVRLEARSITVAAALTDVLLGTGVDVIFSANGRAVLVRRTSASPTGIHAQTGTLAGRVIERGTNMPVAAAQVTVVGTSLARYTDEKGGYRITDVPVGERDVTVRRLGFEPVSRHVRIVDGDMTTLDFTLGRVPTTLTEVVTTATGERSRLEIGNAIGTIKADSIVPTTLIRNMSDLLTARTPGVIVQNTSGMVGQPSRIRIRGISSLQLNNDPIVIVDGVRLLTQTTNDPDQTNVGRATTSIGFVSSSTSFASQNAPSRLDDIDPNTIESIDVLRGPSAATLYGTEAAKGVIVIKTKKGSAGPYRLTLLADNGWSTLPGGFPSQWFSWGHAITGGIITPRGEVGAFKSGNCWISAGNSTGPNYADGTCVLDSIVAFNAANNPDMSTLGTGTARNLSASMSGGTEQLREFLSVRFSDNVGMAKLSSVEERRITQMWSEKPPSWILRPNAEQDLNGSSRTNLHAMSNLDLSLSVSAIYRDVLNGQPPVPGSAIANTAGVTSLADTLIFLPAEALRHKPETVAKRGFASATGNYTPVPWLALHGIFGGDYTLRSDDDLLRPTDCTVPFAPSTGCNSYHLNERGETFVTTLDIGALATFSPVPWLTLRTAIGEQATKTTFYALSASNALGGASNLAFGTLLLSPSPISTNGSGFLYSASESRDASATAGWYIEQAAAIRERLFLTAAFREDAASAFGPSINKQLPVYPKFSLSWLLSDETFFPWKSVISSFRVRTAYGQSGTQARQNDVLGNFTQGSVLDQNGTIVPGLSLSQVANPVLRPERSAEWEGGFDASLLDNERIHVEATLYRKLSQDAIINVPLPPSFGTSALGQASLNQRQNIGAVENRGVELSLTAKILDSRPLAWELTVNMTQNANTLVHLNQSGAPIIFGVVDGRRVGMPLLGYYGKQIRSYADANGDGLLNFNTEVAYTDSNVFFGAPYPKSEVTWINSVTLLNGAVRVNATVDQVNGLSTQLIGFATSSGGMQAMVDPTASLARQAAGIQCLINGGNCYDQSSTVRFSELSLTYTMPRLLVRQLHGQSASVTFAGRNLGLWTTYAGKDPNVDKATNENLGGFSEVTADSRKGIPQPRNWTLRINLGY